jgi:hypothetical protein
MISKGSQALRPDINGMRAIFVEVLIRKIGLQGALAFSYFT